MIRVLDTNVVSLLMKGESAVVERLKQIPRLEVLVPQPVWAEIAYGVKRLPASRQRRRLEERFERLRRELARADWTDAVSDSFGAIKASLERRGERIEDLDVAVAAHALARRAILVTGNRKHMARIRGLEVEDWTTRSP